MLVRVCFWLEKSWLWPGLGWSPAGLLGFGPRDSLPADPPTLQPHSEAWEEKEEGMFFFNGLF